MTPQKYYLMSIVHIDLHNYLSNLITVKTEKYSTAARRYSVRRFVIFYATRVMINKKTNRKVHWKMLEMIRKLPENRLYDMPVKEWE